MPFGSEGLVGLPSLHLVVPDGVFFEADGRVLFRALPKPAVEAVERVAARIARRVHRWLERHELLEEPRDGLAVSYASATQVRRPPPGRA